MHIEEHQWWSKHLNRDMALKVYGHWGKPVIVFPCSRGRYFDYEGMNIPIHFHHKLLYSKILVVILIQLKLLSLRPFEKYLF